MPRKNTFIGLALVSLGFVSGAAYFASCGKVGPANATGTPTVTQVSATGTSATCPAGYYVVGGGCLNTGGDCTFTPTVNNGASSNVTAGVAITKYSGPLSTTKWGCDMDCALSDVAWQTASPTSASFDASTGTSNLTVVTYAICIGPSS